jgi:hypothetical protein
MEVHTRGLGYHPAGPSLRHPDVLALNPQGLVDKAGVTLTNDAQRIVLLRGPTCTSDSFVAMMREYLPPRGPPGATPTALGGSPQIRNQRPNVPSMIPCVSCLRPGWQKRER